MKIYLGLLLLLAVSCHFHEEEEISLEGINWDGVLKCLSNAIGIAPDIYDIVQAIKAKEYETAYTLAINMIGKGAGIVKKCIEGFKGGLLSATPYKKPHPHHHRPHHHPCFLKCRRDLNITWISAKNSTEFKECVEKCKAEWEKKKEEIKEKREKCLKECEHLKQEGEVIKKHRIISKRAITPYQQCLWKCKKSIWKKPLIPKKFKA